MFSVSVFADHFDLSESLKASKEKATFKSSEEFLRHRQEIIGQRSPKTLVRYDLEPVIYTLSEGNEEIRQQLFVHSRAHDLFLTAESSEDAYNAYLLMTAIKYCLASLGLGKEGAKDILLSLAKKQINTEVRRLAAGRADRLLISQDYPPLLLFSDNAEYCKFTTPSDSPVGVDLENVGSMAAN